MACEAKNIALEVIQFAPILTFASSFIVSGRVDLARAGTLFLISGGLAVGVSAAVILAKGKLNPILLGTDIWLLIGALAFGLKIDALSSLLVEWQATGLFVCVLLVGILITVKSPLGFVGVEAQSAALKIGSILLLGLTLLAIIFSILFRDNIRLSGGMPFILLNVSRRALTRYLQNGP